MEKRLPRSAFFLYISRPGFRFPLCCRSETGEDLHQLFYPYGADHVSGVVGVDRFYDAAAAKGDQYPEDHGGGDRADCSVADKKFHLPCRDFVFVCASGGGVVYAWLVKAICI